MPLVHMADMLRHAYDNRYVVGAFHAPGIELVQGVLAAAAGRRAPVILRLREPDPGAGDLDLLAAAAEQAAERASIPVALLLDGATSLGSAIRAINLGCTAVRVDGSALSFDENAALTRAVVDVGRACGVPVEGTLGTGDTAAARRFEDETGIQSLFLFGEASERLDGSLRVPLAMDADGLDPDRPLAPHLDRGVARLGFSRVVSRAAARRLRENALEHPEGEFTDQVQGLADAVREAADACIVRCGAEGRAAEVLRDCRPWTPVEHLIVYNVKGQDPEATRAMMAEGRRVLGTIPGVRRVFTGTSVRDDAPYLHAWLVRFTDAAVIDSYREHPAHRAFADGLFRPVAGGRISIDYAETEAGPPPLASTPD